MEKVKNTHLRLLFLISQIVCGIFVNLLIFRLLTFQNHGGTLSCPWESSNRLPWDRRRWKDRSLLSSRTSRYPMSTSRRAFHAPCSGVPREPSTRACRRVCKFESRSTLRNRSLWASGSPPHQWECFQASNLCRWCSLSACIQTLGSPEQSKTYQLKIFRVCNSL